MDTGFELLRLFVVSVLTVLVLAVGVVCVKRYVERFYLTIVIFGVYVYNGFGFSYSDLVPFFYLWYYFVFIICFVVSFVLFVRVLGDNKGRVFDRSFEMAGRIVDKNSYKIIIAIFCALSLLSLIYPNVVIYKLLSPPEPDISISWNAGLGVQQDAVQTVVMMLKNIVYPFYLISLVYVKKVRWLLFVLFLPYYVEYCSANYLGRSSIGVVVMIVFISLWLSRNKKERIRLGVFYLMFMPFILVFMQIMGMARGGLNGVYIDGGVFDLLIGLMKVETGFPGYFEAVYNSGYNAKLWEYFMWMFTLPIPRIIMISKPIFLGNVEIAEIVGNLLQGVDGFSVTLTGPVSESIYLFGKEYYWVHPFMMGGIAGVMCVLFSSNKKYLFLYSFSVISFSYIFSRAGVCGLMPVIINQYIGFFVLVLYYYYGAKVTGFNR